jgi:crotonobetainyl-CoA:carnitine CoA-transferase CaiB-like acyl-CoA transferase
VYCSITGFGQHGPRANEPGYDFIIQGMGSMMSVTGERDDLLGGGPQKAGLAFADLTTGLYSAIAIQASLFSREKPVKVRILIWRCLILRWPPYLFWP